MDGYYQRQPFLRWILFKTLNQFLDGYIQRDNPFLDGYVQDTESLRRWLYSRY